MAWVSPFPLNLVPGASVDDWAKLGPGETLMPLPPHPGAFGDARARHVHEGIDLYAPPGTPVLAVEDGLVVGVTPFTVSETRGGYWHDMEAVLVAGASGLVVYCEFSPLKSLMASAAVKAGEKLGNLYPLDYAYKNPHAPKVLGPQTHFLHLELHKQYVRAPTKWLVGQPKPASLMDPAPFLLETALAAPVPPPA